MNKGTRKCKSCGKWNNGIWVTTERVSKGRTTSIRLLKKPYLVSREICGHCDEKL